MNDRTARDARLLSNCHSNGNKRESENASSGTSGAFLPSLSSRLI